MTSAAVERLAARLIGLESQVRGLSQPQLAYSTIEGGAVEMRDDTGGLVGQVGTLPDGSGGVLPVNGPTPPTPSAPVLTPVAGGLRVTWDGTFAGGEVAPYTFARVEVHVGDTPGFYDGSAASLRGSIETARGGDVVVVPLTTTAKYAVLVAWTAAGRPGAPSLEVTGTPDAVVSDADLAAVEQTANDAVGTANNAQLVADRAEGKADTAQADASAAITTANGKGKSYFQATAPTGTLTVHDVWFDTDADNAPHRWDGTSWIAQPFGNLAVGNLDAAKIATGFLSAARIATDSIIARHILAGEIKAGHIAANQIQASHIVAGSVTADHLTATAINGKTITGASLRTADPALGGTRVEINADDYVGASATFRLYDQNGANGGTIYSRDKGTIIESAYESLGLTILQLLPTGGAIFDIWGTDGSGGERLVELHPFAAQFRTPIIPWNHVIMKEKYVWFREHGGLDSLSWQALRNGPRLAGANSVDIYVNNALTAYGNASGEWRVATRVYANGVQLSSRSRTKRNVRDVGKGLEAIRALQPRTYERHLNAHGEPLETPNEEQGFILEEVAPVLPEVVGHDPETGDADALDVMGMLTILTKAVQELDAKVNPQRAGK